MKACCTCMTQMLAPTRPLCWVMQKGQQSTFCFTVSGCESFQGPVLVCWQDRDPASFPGSSSHLVFLRNEDEGRPQGIQKPARLPSNSRTWVSMEDQSLADRSWPATITQQHTLSEFSVPLWFVSLPERTWMPSLPQYNQSRRVSVVADPGLGAGSIYET